MNVTKIILDGQVADIPSGGGSDELNAINAVVNTADTNAGNALDKATDAMALAVELEKNLGEKVNKDGDIMTGDLSVPSLLFKDAGGGYITGFTETLAGQSKPTSVVEFNGPFVAGVGSGCRVRGVVYPVEDTNTVNKEYLEDTLEQGYLPIENPEAKHSLCVTSSEDTSALVLGFSGATVTPNLYIGVNNSYNFTMFVRKDALIKYDSLDPVVVRGVDIPQDDNDAANKKYVDDAIVAAIGTIETALSGM